MVSPHHNQNNMKCTKSEPNNSEAKNGFISHPTNDMQNLLTTFF